ncbi:hypothetical protein [Zhongshania arctica]|uniref:Uncharacterized protein n=1 Tax=Zhongshania arctica TaxID=3238302 RepID=A0ABV3TSC9_9GAMM
MNNQTDEFSQEIYETLMIPFWLDASVGIVYVFTIALIIYVSHRLAFRKYVGGVGMLVCVYLSILAAIVPVVFPLSGEMVDLRDYVVLEVSQLASGIFGLFAVVNLLRFVLHITANKQRNSDSGAVAPSQVR